MVIAVDMKKHIQIMTNTKGGRDVFRGDLSVHLTSCDSQFMTCERIHKSILGTVKGIIGATTLFIIEAFLRCYILYLTVLLHVQEKLLLH